MIAIDYLYITIIAVGIWLAIFSFYKYYITSKEEQSFDNQEASDSNQIPAPPPERQTELLEEAGNLERAGRYEDAALIYDGLQMWDKAGECRRMLKTNYVVSANVNISKSGTISIECPIVVHPSLLLQNQMR
jgi:hypothetical protein